MEERLLTKSDLRQFLDGVLAAVRDHLQSPLAFIAALDGEDLALITFADSSKNDFGPMLPSTLERIEKDG